MNASTPSIYVAEITEVTVSVLEYVPVKKCWACGITKPYDQYNKDKSKKTGITHICKPCYKEKYLSNWVGSSYRSNKIAGGHSKYGGPRQELMQEQVEDWWACQSCGETYSEEITRFKFEYPEGEWIRVCAICIRDDCAKLMSRLQTII